MKIVGFMGVSRSGKTTAAQIWQSLHPNSEMLSFASLFKAGVRAMFENLDAGGPEIINQMMEGDLKDVRTPLLIDATPRTLMITVAEAMRERIHPAVFVKTESRRIDELHANFGIDHFVFSDVRKSIEAEMIKERGGKIVHVTGRGHHSGHQTDDLPLWLVDHVIDNSGTIDDLTAVIKTL